MENFLLNVKPDYSVGDYLKDIKEETKEARSRIADALRDRYLNRYINPGKFKNKNGFNIMASCCLLIETLESFHRGWSDTNSKSAEAFCKFFNRVDDFKEFTDNGMTTTFYKNIRCGILHQGETTGGWRIRRDQRKMLNIDDKIIDANHFRDTLEREVKKYFDDLKSSPSESNQWEMLKKKMNYIIKNCNS